MLTPFKRTSCSHRYIGDWTSLQSAEEGCEGGTITHLSAPLLIGHLQLVGFCSTGRARGHCHTVTDAASQQNCSSRGLPWISSNMGRGRKKQTKSNTKFLLSYQENPKESHRHIFYSISHIVISNGFCFPLSHSLKEHFLMLRGAKRTLCPPRGNFMKVHINRQQQQQSKPCSILLQCPSGTALIAAQTANSSVFVCK